MSRLNAETMKAYNTGDTLVHPGANTACKITVYWFDDKDSFLTSCLSAGQKIPGILWYPKMHCLVRNSLPLIPNPSQIITFTLLQSLCPTKCLWC